jgi:hypothetical protein
MTKVREDGEYRIDLDRGEAKLRRGYSLNDMRSYYSGICRDEIELEE